MGAGDSVGASVGVGFVSSGIVSDVFSEVSSMVCSAALVVSCEDTTVAVFGGIVNPNPIKLKMQIKVKTAHKIRVGLAFCFLNKRITVRIKQTGTPIIPIIVSKRKTLFILIILTL